MRSGCAGYSKLPAESGLQWARCRKNLFRGRSATAAEVSEPCDVLPVLRERFSPDIRPEEEAGAEKLIALWCTSLLCVEHNALTMVCESKLILLVCTWWLEPRFGQAQDGDQIWAVQYESGWW